MLTDRVWRFSRSNGEVIRHYLSLRPGGQIAGYSNENERTWRPEGDGIAFLRDDGSPSSILLPDRTGRLIGPLIGHGSSDVWHILAEQEPEYPLGIHWNRECEDLLEQIPVFAQNVHRIRNVYEPGRLVWFDKRCMVERDATMPEGQFWSMGAHSYCDRSFEGRATVGRYSSIAKNCGVMGDDHPTTWVTTSRITYAPRFAQFSRDRYGKPFQTLPVTVKQPPIRIGNDVWVGQDVLFKGGITVGDGAVVAARAVVTKGVPPFTIVGGVPARTIRPRFEPALIARMQRLRWWRFNYPDLPASWDQPDMFLDELETLIATGQISELSEPPIDLGRAVLRASLGLPAFQPTSGDPG